ncbi:MAG: tRNA (guanosine(37)-N1)-methyltransferase TrmD [Deltaproteobacteria bacterium]|nr:tRNA (guanosine(37)-N1)-methyltransferase TrmD [Deltaproteobacteria bacterium]
MRFTIVTLFQGYFAGALESGILGRAREAGLVTVDFVDLRVFGEGRHRVTDDYPFGGGAGMVMKPGPVVSAIEVARAASPGCRVVLLTPQGRLFRQPVARELASAGREGPGGLVLVCGRYEGFDERIRPYCDDELSIGDFVLMGGEAAALVVIEAVARLLPGVLGAEASSEEETLSEGLLEYPQYTRPRSFRGAAVPEVLLGGHHADVAAWRRRQALVRTARRRPDLLDAAPLSDDDRRWARRAAADEA